MKFHVSQSHNSRTRIPSLRAFTLSACAFFASGCMAHAQSYQNSNQGTARIGWGDNFSNAKTVTYTNSYTSNTNNGYTATANSYQAQSNNYNSNHIIDSSYTSVTSSDASSSYPESLNANKFSSVSSNLSRFSNQDLFEQLALTTKSKGIVVYDVESGTPIFQRNADVTRPIASISKILTAMVLLDAGQDMREEIQIQQSDIDRGSVYQKTSSTRLLAGDHLNRAEMMLMMLMKSENPAAKALARNYPGGYHAFMQAMNRKAKELGMNSSWFGDPSGLDRRNAASPNDLVKLLTSATHYDVIRRFSTTPNYNFFVNNSRTGRVRNYDANNTSSLIRNGEYNIGLSKTGFIREAGSCVVMETLVNNRPSLIILLGANNSTARWNDAKNILDTLASRRV